MTKKATVKAVIMFFIVHLPSLPCRPCVEGNEILSEVYNVIDSEEGLRGPLVFNDPCWPMQWKLVWSSEIDGFLAMLRNIIFIIF